MTRLDDDEETILAQARSGLGPTNSDEQRVLQSLRAQIALAPSMQNGTLAKSPWPLRIGGSIAVIGAVMLSGGLGYRKGWEAGIAQKSKADTSINLLVSTPSLPVQTQREPPIAPVPSVEPTPVKLERRVESEARSASTASVLRTHEASPIPSAALGLDEEVRQLRRVERAIREGNPRFALVLLEELDQLMPAGQLLEERRAASIMANCQLGASDAAAKARAFAAKHRGSAYLTRVIEICGLENERNAPGPGTHAPRSGG